MDPKNKKKTQMMDLRNTLRKIMKKMKTSLKAGKTKMTK